jgi:hypothetical protein
MNNAEQAVARVGAKALIRTEVAVSSFDFKIDIHAGTNPPGSCPLTQHRRRFDGVRFPG